MNVLGKVKEQLMAKKPNMKLFRNNDATVQVDYDGPICKCGSLREISHISIDRKNEKNLTLHASRIRLDTVCSNRACPDFQSTRTFRLFDPETHFLKKSKNKNQ